MAATPDERYARGRARFLEVHDERALRAVEGLGELGHHIVAFVYGDVYADPTLSTRDRETPRSSPPAARPSCPPTCGPP